MQPGLPYINAYKPPSVRTSFMDGPSGKSSNGPTPRFGASMAVAKSGQLFLFGGMVEDGDKQITLNDFYCLGEHIVVETSPLT